jgi:hypothetical protein
MAILPFEEWLPDGPAFGNPGTVVALNVVPRSVHSYRPMPARQVIGLLHAPQGRLAAPSWPPMTASGATAGRTLPNLLQQGSSGYRHRLIRWAVALRAGIFLIGGR